jgi:hypothetical protein
MLITQEMLDIARENLYDAVWDLVKAVSTRKELTGDEQETLSQVIIENDNLTFLYGKQVAAGYIVGIIVDAPELDQSAKDDLVGTIGNIYLRSN